MNTDLLEPWLPHRSRRQGTKVDTIVLHATAGGSLMGALQALSDPDTQYKLRGQKFRGNGRSLSYHYIIEEDGRIVKCVPTSKVAFHAGVSEGPQGDNCNEYSIGVSFVNFNDGKDPYSKAQYDACKALIQELRAAMPELQILTTHYAVSPGRKFDPRGFPVLKLANELGMTAWLPKGELK
jgi:N-acetylmuramoyl-L-alanine amidase